MTGTTPEPEAPAIPGVTRWRKRPVEVEAVQWTGANVDEVLAFAGGGYFDTVPPEDRAEDPDMTAEVYDKLHGTWVHVYDGQWIIRGVRGELYPCAGDVFAATYEPAGEPLTDAQCDRVIEMATAYDAAASAVQRALELAGTLARTAGEVQVIAAARDALRVLSGEEEAP